MGRKGNVTNLLLGRLPAEERFNLMATSPKVVGKESANLQIYRTGTPFDYDASRFAVWQHLEFRSYCAIITYTSC